MDGNIDALELRPGEGAQALTAPRRRRGDAALRLDDAVVFGASGFIGTRLVRRLAAAGSQRVRALDIAPPRERLPGVRYEAVDVRAPIDPSLGAGDGVIFNLAAVHRTPGHPPEEYYATNIAGALNVTRFAETTGARKIVFTSSISVYGPCEETVDEGSALRPSSDYGRSKRLAEVIHRDWAERGRGRRLVTVRPGVVFGPGERGNYTALARALRRGYFVYPGRRDTIKSGGYVDELLRALEFALTGREAKPLLNFAYPEESTISDIVAAFGHVTGRPRRPLSAPYALVSAAAAGLNGLSAVGLPTWIHPERVTKLVRSTRVRPGWLLDAGYVFATDLERALGAWRDETDGRFE